MGMLTELENSGPRIGDAAKDDQLLDQIYAYLVDDANECKKRVIREKARKFLMKEGELFYRQAATKHKVCKMNG